MDYKKNDIVTIEIRDISHEGEGIGKIDGYPFFVKDTVIGDKAQVRVTRVKKNYAYGRLEKVLEPSACRREPACPFTGSAEAVRFRPWIMPHSSGSRRIRSGTI